MQSEFPPIIFNKNVGLVSKEYQWSISNPRGYVQTKMLSNQIQLWNESNPHWDMF